MEEKIIAVKHHKISVPVAYKTNLGHIYDYEKAVEMVENGAITNAAIEVDSSGIKHIRHKR